MSETRLRAVGVRLHAGACPSAAQAVVLPLATEWRQKVAHGVSQ
jgi:hypothetical protein